MIVASKFRAGGIAALALGCAALVGCDSTPEAPSADHAPAPVATLPASTVAQCRQFIALGEREGLIRARPAPNRINVEDGLWAQLDAETKDRFLQAVSCDLWATSAPAGLDHVVAYGYRSGKRLQMLSSAGMVRE